MLGSLKKKTIEDKDSLEEIKHIVIKGYKGFNIQNGELYCRGLHYPINEQVIYDGPLVQYRYGLHFSERLSTVFNYYPPHRSFYAMRGRGDVLISNNITVHELLHGIDNGMNFRYGFLCDNAIPHKHDQNGICDPDYLYARGKFQYLRSKM